ncbi:hypothetical protein ACIREO_11950 [Streptomyces sp. NPDC102441]|uniref:hypothetical protein n=1 Tax=Streptomyces sp. NPDC102441 TaxID=3366176 RepID=UPI00382DEC7E
MSFAPLGPHSEGHRVRAPERGRSKGLTSCSGGNSRFAELDDDSKGLAVWNVADTDNAFYACTDVNFDA